MGSLLANTHAVPGDGALTLTAPRDTLSGNDFHCWCTITGPPDHYRNGENHGVTSHAAWLGLPAHAFPECLIVSSSTSKTSINTQ